MTEPDVQRCYEAAAAVLDELHVPHAFIGALAAIVWGRQRMTTDIDVVIMIDKERWGELDSALKARNFEPSEDYLDKPALPPIAVYWWKGTERRIRADVFVAYTAFEEAVLATLKHAPVLGRQMPVASPEAVIVYKLLASRSKDITDLEAVFAARAEAKYPLDWAFIEHWCAEWEITDRLAPWRAQYGPRG